jgi:hypothetical protein
MMIERAMTMIFLLYFQDVNRGEVKNYSIWKDRIEAGHGFADLNFTETPLQGRIHDEGLNPFRDISLGFFDGDDKSSETSTWWYLSRISLGPWDHIV